MAVVGRGLFRSFPADGKPTSRFPSALDVALYEIIKYKLRILREHIKDYNSGHENPAFGAVLANSQEQELPFPTRQARTFCAAPEINCPFCKSSTENHYTGAGPEQRRRSGLRRKPAQRW
jgi:hypothetical protein